MALTRPFINTVGAFDARDGVSFNVCVLGGDAIVGYNYKVYNNYGDLTPIYTSGIVAVSNDVESESIRTFDAYMPPNILQNNNSYKIEPIVYGKKVLDEFTDAMVGQQAFCECYLKPVVRLQTQELDGTSIVYSDLESNSTVGSSVQTFRIYFNKNNFNSIAQPNIAEVKLYGIRDDGTRALLFNNDKIFKFENEITDPLVYYTNIDVSGFTITQDSSGAILSASERQYKSFSISLQVQTIENMYVSIEYTNIGCYYQVLTNSPYLVVNNLCNKGVIQINSSIVGRLGGSNIPLSSLVYIPTATDKELDLKRATYGKNVRVYWSKYFKVSKPYTFEIWGRNFDIGPIAYLYSDINANNIVSLRYNTEKVYNSSTETFDNYAFISLTSSMIDNAGQQKMSYYIESERIPTSNIGVSTKLFIGIQQNNDSLFDINFEII